MIGGARRSVPLHSHHKFCKFFLAIVSSGQGGNTDTYDKDQSIDVVCNKQDHGYFMPSTLNHQLLLLARNPANLVQVFSGCGVLVILVGLFLVWNEHIISIRVEVICS